MQKKGKERDECSGPEVFMDEKKANEWESG